MKQLKPKLLKRKEVAEILSVTEHTIRKYEILGLLPSIRTNERVVRYRLEDVEKLISDSLVENHPVVQK